MRIGFDIDGVLADFRSAFRDLAQRVLGRAVAPEEELRPGDVKRLWEEVARTSNWWLDVPAHEPEQLARVYALARQARWEVFFMTSRPASAGDSVLVQTQVWLERQGFLLPSVLTIAAGGRGELARMLRLDLMIDDQLLNCVDVVASSNAKAILLLRGRVDASLRHTAQSRGIGVVSTLRESVEVVEHLQDLLKVRKGRLLRLAEWLNPPEEEGDRLPHDPRQPRS